MKMMKVMQRLWVLCIVIIIFAMLYNSIASSGILYNLGPWLFVLAAIFLSPIIIYPWYKNKVVDRVVFAFELFLLLWTVGFLLNIPAVFFLLEKYQISLILFFLMGIGILTTFCTSSGFVGIISSDKKAVFHASLKLLGLTALTVLVSLYVPRLSLLSVVLIRWYSDHLGQQIDGEKAWRIKW